LETPIYKSSYVTNAYWQGNNVSPAGVHIAINIHIIANTPEARATGNSHVPYHTQPIPISIRFNRHSRVDTPHTNCRNTLVGH